MQRQQQLLNTNMSKNKNKPEITDEPTWLDPETQPEPEPEEKK